MRQAAKTPATFDRFAVARTLERRQAGMMLQLGAEIQDVRLVRCSHRAGADECAETALVALTYADWKSMKLARAYLSAGKLWIGY